MKRLLIGLLMVCFFAMTGFTPSAQPAPKELIFQMIEHTQGIYTMLYTMRKFERINGKMIEQIADIKYNKTPYKVYSRQKYPNNGLEVLYITGKNRNRVLVNPNGFPWMNVSLDPHGSQMRKEQHHTILDTGYTLIMNIMRHMIKKYNKDVDALLKVVDIVTIDGKKCWVLELNNPHFRYRSYTVQKGEDLISIADKFMLSEHMILEKNEDIEDYWDIETGQKILIPNDYCRKMVLTIEQDRMIPRVMKIHDEQGIYELYDFKNVVINLRFKEEEFTRGYTDYGF